MTTFSETGASTPWKYIAEQGIVIPSWSKTFQTFCSHSSVFALQKQPENLNFQKFFISRRPYCGYFQWNASIYFQKICSWATYSDAKSIKNISNVLFALLRFCFRKQPKFLNFQNLFFSRRPFSGYFQ